MKKIMLISDIFQIQKRGIVVTGTLESEVQIALGQEVVVIKPDGLTVRTSINGIEYFHTVSGVQKTGIYLSGIRNKVEIPAGSTLYSISTHGVSSS